LKGAEELSRTLRDAGGATKAADVILSKIL